MPERFRPRHQEGDDYQVPQGQVERNGAKLDKIGDDLTDMRVAYVSLASDVKALVERQGRHDSDHTQRDVERTVVVADVERRLRHLERRLYAIPGASVVLAALGLFIAAWNAWGK